MKKSVIVTQRVEVEIDETKFTDQFMEEFRSDFYEFHSLGDHIKHLAQLSARGFDSDFIEGYGEKNNMGIKCNSEVLDMEIE